MTLPASGAISLSQIAGEFGLATNSTFPAAFYGKGGAPASGVLRFGDFYGRTGSPPIGSTGDVYLSGFSQSGTSTITCAAGKTIASITLQSGASTRITPGSTGGNSTIGSCNTPASGSGTFNGTYRYTTNTGEFIDVNYSGDWGTL